MISDHLILGKISKFVATRCKLLRQKCTKFDFGWGSEILKKYFYCSTDLTAVVVKPASRHRHRQQMRL